MAHSGGQRRVVRSSYRAVYVSSCHTLTHKKGEKSNLNPIKPLETTYSIQKRDENANPCHRVGNKHISRGIRKGRVITQMTLWIPIRPWAKEHLNRSDMTAS